MTFLPIVVRELRVAARRKATYRVRFWTAVAAVLVGGGLVIVLSNVPLEPGMGWPIFQGFAGVCFFHCLLMASNTADCVSEEKREGTLGLLFLTDLNGWDVALGKLCANSLKSFYAVLGTFPVVAIVLVLGGVSAGQFCKVALALLNVFFFAHVAGLLASVLCRALATAHAVTALLLIGFLGGLPLLGIAIEGGQYNQVAQVLAAFSPGYAFVQMMLPTGGQLYWTSLILVHFICWSLLALASWRLPYCWQEKAGPIRLRWRDRFRQWTYGSPEYRNELRRKLAGINPFFWLVSRNRLTSVFLWSFLGVIECLFFWGVCESEPSDRNGLLIFNVCVVHFFLIGGVAAEASRRLEEQRISGALEFVLCSTPLPPEAILAGQWLALRRIFLQPLIFILVADLAMFFFRHTRFVYAQRSEESDFDWFMLVAIVMLVVWFVAVGWVGMWRAMANKRPRQNVSVIETGFLVVFCPLVILLIIAGCVDIFADQVFDNMPDSIPFALWFLLALGMAAGLSFWARRQLLTQFRSMAVVQSGEALGFLGWLGRRLGTAVRRRQPKVVTSSSRL